MTLLALPITVPDRPAQPIIWRRWRLPEPEDQGHYFYFGRVGSPVERLGALTAWGGYFGTAAEGWGYYYRCRGDCVARRHPTHEAEIFPCPGAITYDHYDEFTAHDPSVGPVEVAGFMKHHYDMGEELELPFAVPE